jgi:hypothetical protein
MRPGARVVPKWDGKILEMRPVKRFSLETFGVSNWDSQGEDPKNLHQWDILRCLFAPVVPFWDSGPWPPENFIPGIAQKSFASLDFAFSTIDGR